MAKSFTDSEREIIRSKLIESCMESWSKYGYHKTNVSELCQIAGISTGAFYQFFASKELLFVESAMNFVSSLSRIFDGCMQESPDKNGFANGMKATQREIQKMGWFSSLPDVWPLLVRKLPPDFVEQDFRDDMKRYQEIIEKYNLKSKKNLEEISSILQLVSTSALLKIHLYGDANQAWDFIVDIVVDALFD
ncbi:MAG: TetR/AcrR family transcriptional regulator [Treponema sp.]|jgi:AcrR family transcriptional regulator|nr:TetR/AcrR family transcriptional regulator [Treponema sp.]